MVLRAIIISMQFLPYSIFSSRGRQNGFTLIEVMIAIFLVGVVLVLFQTVIVASIMNRRVEYQETALRIASAAMENVRALPSGTLPTSSLIVNPLLSSLPKGEAILTTSSFKDNTTMVMVIVSWVPLDVTNSVYLATLVTSRGL